ncbi:MAG TPA: GH25 family lysozyme [Planctomycetota bacterium]|nr:GH25 family lysozyme [Planctomycetota bacterium]
MARGLLGAAGLVSTFVLSLGAARADDMTLRTFDVTVTEGGSTVHGKAEANLLSSDATASLVSYSLERDVSGPSAAYKHGSAIVNARAGQIHVIFTKDGTTTPRSTGIIHVIDENGTSGAAPANAPEDPTLRLTLKLVEPPDPVVHLFAADWTKNGHSYHEEWRELTNTVKGVDVSVFDGKIDWSALKRAGVGFAITRVSDGMHQDQTFEAHWASMKNAGIVRGVYQFFRGNHDPIAQADLLLEKVGKLQPGDLPPFLDVEQQTKTSPLGGVSRSTFVSNMRKWIQRIEEKTGRKPVVYVGSFFWDDDVGHPDVGGLDLWLAQYVKDPNVSKPRLPQGWSKWTFWQYSEKAHFPGVPVACDASLFNGTLSDLLAYAWGTSGATASSGGSATGGTTTDSSGTGTASDGSDGGLEPPPAKPKSPVQVTRTLREGDYGPEVSALQLAIGMPRKEVDGVFGPQTKAALEHYQRRHHLRVDGIAGKETLGALNLR